ncbi:DUF167 domain-containing protein [Catellatospora citrea]|uniref:DUF167 domain-containing protein n=1 Tax=Catellatospora citrea TaxID=53366 RepID=UPI000E710CEF|nr:DUF167 domain-containing protein [Catellatospora citrea]
MARDRSSSVTEPAVVAVRVKPGAGRTRVGGAYPGPHGIALIVAVQAPAVDGRATEAARRALADALSLPAASVSLRTGLASRDKLFLIETPPADLAARLTALHEAGR